MVALLPKCLFVGAMVASTDASAVLACNLCRDVCQAADRSHRGVSFNDPMAVVLAGLALALAGGSGMERILVTDLVRQFCSAS